MATDNLQPIDSIGAAPKASDPDLEDPAKRDYMEGRKFFQEGEYAQAAIAFHNALRGFEEKGDQIGVANAADRLGDACLARGEYAMALANFKQAHAICEKEDDSFSVLSINKKMAAAYRKLGDHDKALEMLFDILEHYRLTSNPKGAVEVLSLIAETYNEKGDKTSAADAYRSVASIHKRFKHERMAEQFAQRAAELAQEG
ncbi:tetratricopeptide repeat protein [Desulfobulbus rhabdoformis]|jgi:tetratricopeptide (TPR) repeat protein|uniref:tetratricopeptide repeat protein n=1 Tax=Desulfobulbus rhabdoformis TaxID=34032 RepID=UPI0019647060|nr:tetratricopeptide repeat protein [Desulfobulbus rhabdoformis]MBM9614665.1 tetratricopeptide repeat protein [Desulfobulbus rhabdoformis]